MRKTKQPPVEVLDETALSTTTTEEVKEEIKATPEEQYPVESFGIDTWIPLDELYVDIEAQRGLMEHQVKKIITDFKPESFGRLTVSKRESDGKYYVQNGQHRAEALRRLGFKKAPCILVTSSTLKDEAVNFIKINLGSATVSTLDKFRVGVSAGVPEWLNVKRVLEEVDLSAGGGKSSVSAVSTLYSYINSPSSEDARNKKFEVMKIALTILKETVPVEFITQTSILGMCIFTKAFISEGYATEKMVIDKFKKIQLDQLIKKAQSMKDASTRGKVVTYLAWVLCEEYNKGLRGSHRLTNTIKI